MTDNYELPTTPGLYVSHTAIADGNPAGAVIWFYDADDDEWYEYNYWLDEFPDTYVSAYPEGLKEAARKFGWKMMLLVPQITGPVPLKKRKYSSKRAQKYLSQSEQVSSDDL